MVVQWAILCLPRALLVPLLVLESTLGWLPFWLMTAHNGGDTREALEPQQARSRKAASCQGCCADSTGKQPAEGSRLLPGLGV